jgi:hypothetical protein
MLRILNEQFEKKLYKKIGCCYVVNQSTFYENVFYNEVKIVSRISFFLGHAFAIIE